MENVDKYTKRLFFDKSKDCKDWRSKTLSKAREKLEIGIIRAIKGGRAIGESSAWTATSAIEVGKKSHIYTHSTYI